ncbi:GDSL-like Lipase/Acylhydrolase-domain-containing protein [Radiomyces spectabilis]|uniref:GDSL-like Lipase/Acylhydrolase-domain-containing protein n=1 Tax=Radiomyces spectabilis TaxID=64574 RepID=UPI00221E6AF2|nr:GDSL-like Lipase/Acylhydrolase-domain-containing protein [Radiomyces spectabilis]KAI8377402.1 GDSL-like Lipase/Acylhydrolase-domain-containing protein [Radiomyces spectabilis]
MSIVCRWLALTLLLVASCAASSIKNIVVFGDSYSDTGNLQQMSNGPMWLETLAVGWNAALYNFAFSDAVCDRGLFDEASVENASPGIKDQLEMYYREDLKLDPNETVYVVWAGINDIEKLLRQRAHKDEAPQIIPDISPIVNCLIQQIRNIRKVFGGHRFITLNTVPFEFSPYFSDTALDERRNKAIHRFNALLKQHVIRLNQQHSTLELDLVDVHALLSDIAKDPVTFGFKEGKKAYWDVCQGRCSDDVDSYVWWDRVHLTGGAGQTIANSVLSSGSMEIATSVASLAEVRTLLNETNSSFKSPVFKARYHTGVIEEIIQDKKAKQTSVESSMDEPFLPENPHPWMKSISILLFLLGFLCLGLVIYKKQRRRTGSGIAALSALVQTNRQQGRGQFMPLHNTDAEP